MAPHDSLVEFMRQQRLLLVTAESCTAGLIASTLAEVPGAGQLLDCAFVTYSPQAKERCLGVSPQTMASAGLTSEAVAREMAVGALSAVPAANVAVSNTGVADDGGGDVAAGTQCFAWAFRRQGHLHVHTETRRFSGDRQAVREAAAAYALSRIPFYYGIQSP